MINAAQRIRNCRQLRQAIKNGAIEFLLLLTGGACSRKLISLEEDNRFRVFNYIDDSTQTLTGKQLYTRSNIGRAMRQGTLVTEGESHD